jgi:hypothetical protein
MDSSMTGCEWNNRNRMESNKEGTLERSIGIRTANDAKTMITTKTVLGGCDGARGIRTDSGYGTR